MKKELEIKKLEKGISINGIVDEKAELRHNQLKLYNKSALIELIRFSFKELFEYLKVASIVEKPDWFVGEIEMQLCMDYEPEHDWELEMVWIQVLFVINPLNWHYPFSIKEFSVELKNILENYAQPEIHYVGLEQDDYKNTWFTGIAFHPISSYHPHQYYDMPINLLKNKFSKIKDKLINELDFVLIRYYNFPKSVQKTCMQYLFHFSEFLQDLNIDNNSEIKEKAGQVIFKVTPKDKNIALSKIAEALNIYLAVAPTQMASMEIDLSSIDTIPISRWKVAILHFQSQLKLKEAELRIKDATIQQLELSTSLLKRIIDGGKIEENDEEEIIKGIISVGTTEVSGMKINLAEVYRRIKKIFGN